MPDFHERLARLADAVRSLPDGEEPARALMRLAADVDAYLEQERSRRYEHGADLFQEWNKFMIASIHDVHEYYADRRAVVRRDLARLVAASPRWQGGYADALALLEEKQTP